MSMRGESITEDSFVQCGFGDSEATRRYTIPEILHVLKAETQKYEYRNEHLRRQGQVEYTVPSVAECTPKLRFVTTCVESTAEEIAVPQLFEKAIRLKQVLQALKQIRPQLHDPATAEDETPAKDEFVEDVSLRGGAPEPRPSVPGIACVLEASSKEYEYDSRYPLLGPNQHPANYLVREQRRNYTDYRNAIAAGSVSELEYVATWAEAATENFCVPHEDQKEPRPNLILYELDEAATVEKAGVKVDVSEGQKFAKANANAQVLKTFKAIVDDAGICLRGLS